jgi:hypothetical protein
VKTFLFAVALSLTLNPAVAAEEDKAPTAQQERMKNCNKEAEGLKGDERKAFMKKCLSRDSSVQQDKMKVCNKEAEGLKGDERKDFMSECLSAHPSQQHKMKACNRDANDKALKGDERKKFMSECLKA